MSDLAGSRESQIARRWARAAFNLAHYGDSDPDAALLKQKVGEFWAPVDYTGDEDEIIRVAILEAVKEINGGHDRAKAWVDRQDGVPGLSYDIEEHVLDREYEGEGA